MNFSTASDAVFAPKACYNSMKKNLTDMDKTLHLRNEFEPRIRQ